MSLELTGRKMDPEGTKNEPEGRRSEDYEEGGDDAFEDSDVEPLVLKQGANALGEGFTSTKESNKGWLILFVILVVTAAGIFALRRTGSNSDAVSIVTKPSTSSATHESIQQQQSPQSSTDDISDLPVLDTEVSKVSSEGDGSANIPSDNTEPDQAPDLPADVVSPGLSTDSSNATTGAAPDDSQPSENKTQASSSSSNSSSEGDGSANIPSDKSEPVQVPSDLKTDVVSPGLSTDSSNLTEVAAPKDSKPSENKPQASSSSSSSLPPPPVGPSQSCEQDNKRAIPPLGRDYPSDFKVLRERFQKARLATQKQLANFDYGPENYKRIFEPNGTSVGLLSLRSASLSKYLEVPKDGGNNESFPGLSWEHMKRKFQMKVLQAMQHIKSPKDGDKMISFVWASGGHSAAAAHGDLYNESYSAVIERFVRPSFQELGIWFQGKNYAMGGTESGPEVALCVPAIFGLDIDVLSWDFAMTDGGSLANFELYFRQASRLQSRPATIGLIMQGSGYPGRVEVLRNLEQVGVPALYLPPELQKQVEEEAIPDSFGLTQAQLDAMPPYVQSYKCNGEIEHGSPGCDEKKWTQRNLTDMTNCYWKYRTGWHPGWKWHALIGNLVGSALLQIMDEALADLEQRDMSDPVARYYELKVLEDRDYATLYATSNLTSNHSEMIKNYTDWAQAFDIPYLFKNRAICHTARLPAESRYLGIMTESNQVGFLDYYKGISRQTANTEANNGEFMRLVYDEHERMDCPFIFQMDYKDYYLLKEEEGTKKLVLPNKKEINAYGMRQPLKGLVGIAFVLCDWGKCENGDTREPGLELGEWEMTINGIQVKRLLNIQSNSRSLNFAWHNGGFYFKPNSEGQYEIKARVKEVGKFIRFSTFIFL